MSPDPTSNTGSLLLTLCDQAGITRVKLIPASKRDSVEHNGTSLSLTTALLIGADDSIADLEKFPAAHGDVRLYPDVSSSRVFDASSGQVWAPADQRTPDGQTFSVCQRSILRRQIERMRSVGLDPVAAIEIEFAVYHPVGDEWHIVDDSAGYGIYSLIRASAWMKGIMDAFDAAGIPLEQIHPEYGRGQYEVALGVRDPLTAVDDYVLARILITRVLAEHGLRVSFSPKPEGSAAGNGCHIHLSATDAEGVNVFSGAEGESSFSATGGHWIGALVDELPDIVAILASGPHSFDRLQPGAYSGAMSCWGLENREAAVRYIPGVSGQRNKGANIEVKVPDCTNNPYLAMAALLAVGVQGIETGTALPAALKTVPAKSSEEELLAARASRFPNTLSEALARLDASAVLRGALGDDAIDTFVGVRRLDLAAEKIDNPEDLYVKYRWQQ